MGADMMDGFLRRLAIAGLYPAKRVTLGKSAVAVPLTGTTSETLLASVPIPAGCMGLNGALRVYSLWTYGGVSANNRSPRVRMGGLSGTAFMSLAASAAGVLAEERIIQNRNSASSQICKQFNTTAASVAAGALTTGTINTALPTTIGFTGQLVTGTDTLTLEAYIVELLR